MNLSAEQQLRVGLICRRYGVQRLQMFGSAAIDRMGPASDIDLLVEFVPGQAPGAFALVDMQDELSAAFDHRAIDLAFPSVLRNPYRRREIEPQLRAVYFAHTTIQPQFKRKPPCKPTTS